MKRTTTLVMGILLCAALALGGCRSNVAGNFGKNVQDWKQNDGKNTEPQTDLGTYTDGQMADKLAFNVTAYPETDAFTPTKFFAISYWFAQIEYETPNGNIYVARVAKEGNKDVASSYDEKHDTDVSTQTVDGVEVRTGVSGKGCTLVSWTRDGFNYLVHSRPDQEPLSDEEVQLFVQGLAAEESET